MYRSWKEATTRPLSCAPNTQRQQLCILDTFWAPQTAWEGTQTGQNCSRQWWTWEKQSSKRILTSEICKHQKIKDGWVLGLKICLLVLSFFFPMWIIFYKPLLILLQYCFYFMCVFLFLFLAARHVGSLGLCSSTKDRTHIPCIRRQGLSHWTTREFSGSCHKWFI